MSDPRSCSSEDFDIDCGDEDSEEDDHEEDDHEEDEAMETDETTSESEEGVTDDEREGCG